MLSKQELANFLDNNDESDRFEFTESTKKIDKFSEAICAFANDYPNHKKAGYLIIGVKDNKELAGLKVSDELQKDIASIRHNGQVLPQPALTMKTFAFEKGEVLVIEVQPASHPPVRYKGKIWIRTGATKAIANEQEERILIEKRTATAHTFDALPCWESSLENLNLPSIQLEYLPLAIDKETLEANHRALKQQLASLRLFDLVHQKPTNAGILLFGFDPKYFFAGAYIQYLKIDSRERELDKVVSEKAFIGNLFIVLREIDNFIKYNIVISKPVRIENSFQDKMVSNYPYMALRELTLNAIMHKDYQANTPVYIYEFSDRIEIHNAGFLYGQVTKENFPYTNDYRNPVLAEAMKNMGYVNRFNFGIKDAQKRLVENGNQPAEFNLSLATKFVVTIKNLESEQLNK